MVSVRKGTAAEGSNGRKRGREDGRNSRIRFNSTPHSSGRIEAAVSGALREGKRLRERAEAARERERLEQETNREKSGFRFFCFDDDDDENEKKVH
jgi:hypothetical protein